MRGDAAAKAPPELLLDVARQAHAARRAKHRGERREVLAHHDVQRRLLGLAAQSRTTTPFIHLPAYVEAEQGGWLRFHFAVRGASPIQYRPRGEPGAVIPPPSPNRWEWTPQVFNVKRNGPFFE
jgi:hypothetical protein